MLSILLLALATPPLPAPAPQSADSSSPGPLSPGAETAGTVEETPWVEVRYNGRTWTFSRNEFRDWLIRFQGQSLAARFVQALRLGELAREYGFEVTEAVVRDRTEQELEERVQVAFDGDREAWLEELRRTGRTPERLMAQRMIENRMHLEAEAVAQARRVVTDEDIEEEFRKRHGPGGLTWEVSPLSVRYLQPNPPDGTPPDERRRLRNEARLELEDRMQVLYEQLTAGADFDAMVEKHGDDLSSLTRSAQFPDPFPSPDWPRDKLDNMQSLPVGAYTEPVYARGAYHILRIDTRRVAHLDDEAEQIRADLETRTATAAEVKGVLAQVLHETDWELLPTQTEPGPRDGSEPVLRIEDRTVDRETLGSWLLGLNAEGMELVFVEHALVARLAREAGFELDPEAPPRRIREDIRAMADRVFGGDVDRFLRQHGSVSEEGHIAAQLQVVEHHIATEYLMALDHTASEEEVRQAWRERYGDEGREVRVRLIELEMPRVGPEVDAKDVVRERDRLFAETEELASQLARRIENGEDFATLASRHSSHSSRQHGGELNGPFLPFDWPASVRAEVLAAERGDVLGPVSDGPAMGRVWVFEVLSARDMPFDATREALRQELEQRRPPATARASWLNSLTQALEYEPR